MNKLLAACILTVLILGGAARAADPWAHPVLMTVVMVDDKFQPDHLTFGHGTTYDLRLVNRGAHMHEFTAPAFLHAATVKNKGLLASRGTDIVVQPGKTVDVLLIAPAAGQYELTCADHDWDGMVGAILVN